MYQHLNGEPMTIFGDGEQTRDFTYVLNAVKANILSLTTDNQSAFGGVYNVACGEYYSLNKVINEIQQNLKSFGKFNNNSTIVHGPERPGDVRDSLADITNTKADLGYVNPISFNAGMSDYLKSMFS